MNIISIHSPIRQTSHGPFSRSRLVTPREFLRVTLSDDLAKARALQRWENEGGRVTRKKDHAAEALATQGAR